MIILLFFSFLAGIFTVLSPCILPILPAILSAGTLGGKRRPFGIIVGLICSFTFFTLALTAIVQATGLSANALRYAAIVLIFVFGCIMIFPRLSGSFARVTANFASIGQKIQQKPGNSGFWGGFVFGAALGLLWTPCAGPILGAITTLVATHAINLTTVLLTLSYSIGAGLPMFFIAYGGSRIIQSSQFLSRHSECIRQGFGCLMVALAIALVFHWDMLLQEKIARVIPSYLIEKNLNVEGELSKLQGEKQVSNEGMAPEIVGITTWINSPPLTIHELHGKVVLIDFWTYSCINCLRTLPYIKKWNEDYKDKGLVIIGVHTPEFEFEKDPQNVASAVKRLGVTYPVALDNEYKTWNAYHNNYWPAHYLIDQNGEIRMEHFGEGGYVETENAIRELLGLNPLVMQEPKASNLAQSPETYLGLSRSQNYISQITLKPHQIADYSYTQILGDDQVGLKGVWRAEDEYIISESDGSYIDYNFLAKEVYLVLSGSSKTQVEVYLDGKLAKQFYMDGDRKYDIVSTSYGRHIVSIKIPKGVSAYAFTFGS